MSELVKTLHLRVKDKHAKLLLAQSREVNLVWNFCNETAINILNREQRFCSGYDLDKLTSGASKELSIHSQTIQAVASEYVTRRRQFKKRRLNWRKSRGCKRSLGWVPFKKAAVKYKNGQVWYQGTPISLWEQAKLSQYELGQGSFSEDSKGHWYFNTTVKVQPKANTSTSAVGIDLGLKACATTSEGAVLEGRNYRKLEPKLAKAQRAKKKKQVKSIHQKIKNTRKDEIHKFSSKIVKENGAVIVGNVSSSKLIKTDMAKSTLDAGWFMLKTILLYKCLWAGIVFEEVNESYSTQTCNVCGSIEGPKGLEGLEVRKWVCSCGCEHDRDVNAAINIRNKGLSKIFSIAGEGSTDEAVMNKGLETNPVSD